LDDLLQELLPGRPVRVLKIDVEGAELQVLEGAAETIAGNRSLVLLLDIHPERGVDARQVCDCLRGQGFRLMREEPPFVKEVPVSSSLHSLVAVRGAE
jgi:hypothetical protein